MTGPTSEVKTGSESKTSRQRSIRRSACSGAWMCCIDPAVGACVVELARVLDHALECPPGGAHALDGHDLVLERQDRLDLQRAAQPGLGLADAPSALEVLEGVQAEPYFEHLARRSHARGDGVLVGARASGGGGGEHQQPHPAAGGFRVQDLDAIAQATLCEQPVRLVGGLAGARDAAGEVDRDDILAGLDQGLPGGEEVADRGLGGGRQFGVAAQALVEAVEALHFELALGLALPAHVQADLMDALTVRQCARDVVRAVGGDRDGGHAARDATAEPARAPRTRTSP